jgi:hypothetical protein
LRVSPSMDPPQCGKGTKDALILRNGRGAPLIQTKSQKADDSIAG